MRSAKSTQIMLNMYDLDKWEDLILIGGSQINNLKYADNRIIFIKKN